MIELHVSLNTCFKIISRLILKNTPKMFYPIPYFVDQFKVEEMKVICKLLQIKGIKISFFNAV